MFRSEPNLRFDFRIEHPGERAAGTASYVENVRVEVEYGFLDPTDANELQDAIRQTLAEFYDGAKVTPSLVTQTILPNVGLDRHDLRNELKE